MGGIEGEEENNARFPLCAFTPRILLEVAGRVAFSLSLVCGGLLKEFAVEIVREIDEEGG